MTNEEKAKDMTMCIWYPQKLTENDIQKMLIEMAEWKEQQESEKKCILCKYYQPDLLKCDNLGLKSYTDEFFGEFHCCDYIEDNDRKYKPKKQNRYEYTGNNKRIASIPE